MKTAAKKTGPARLAAGLLIGLLNGFFGSGGGVAAVEVLQKLGLDAKEAHATSILVILPLSLASAVIYLAAGQAQLGGDTLALLAGASCGGLAGARLLGRLAPAWVETLFTLLILAAGVRMVL